MTTSTTTSTTTTTASPNPTPKATPSTRPAPPSGPVTAELVFFAPPPDGAIPFNNVDYELTGLPERNFDLSTHSVLISDIRDSPADTFTLDHDAFTVLPSQPPSSPAIDWDSEDSVKTHYYPEVERLLLKYVPGASRIYIFDHTVRRADPAAAREPVLRVHIDQTAKSATQRVHRHLGTDAETLLKGRWRIINVWRPLTVNPVESYPLAFASSASVTDEEVTPVEHRYPDGYLGETAGVKYAESQKWFYLSGMRNDERLLIECFDSEGLKKDGQVKGGRVPHTAFKDPRTREGAEARESIEVRALVFGP